MLSFHIDNNLTQEILKLNEAFAAKAVFINSLTDEERRYIHKYARISMIGASTRIENAILTDSEIGWLDSILEKDGKGTAFEANRKIIQKKLSKDKERSIEEVAGCRTMLHLIYEQGRDNFPLTETQLRALHNELLRYYSKPGILKGQYKDHPNSVVEENHGTGEKRMVFKTADPGVVTQTSMADLISWYNKSMPTETWTIAVICEFVFRFLAIHPFQDGNGRLGRGLFLLSLIQTSNKNLSSVAPYIAIDRQIEKHKEEYYIVLNRCSNGFFSEDPTKYEMHHFLKYMVKILNQSLEDVNYYHKRHIEFKNLSVSALEILNTFKEKPEVKLTLKELHALTKIPQRTITHSLSSLVQKQFIQRLGKGAGTRYQLVF